MTNERTSERRNERLGRGFARDHIAPAPVFVLVEPQMGENIGAAARAMLNFGVSGLRLVNPRDGWPNEKAGAMAAGAAPVLDNVRVFEDLDAALFDCQYVVATTARRRELMTPVLSLRDAVSSLSTRVGEGLKCAVVFGGERNGLSSEDVARADAILTVPVNPAFSSLNLAQAVCLVSYEWSMNTADISVTPAIERSPAVKDDVAGLVDHLERELDDVGYFFPEEKKPLMARNLRVALTRAGFTRPEIHSLRGAIKALVSGRRKT